MATNRNPSNTVELIVPVYAYAKRVLQYLYGENLQNDKMKTDFLIAAGNLLTQTHRSDKIFKTQFLHNIPVGIIEVSEVVPERTLNFLRIYDKDSLRYSLGHYFNKKAKDILLNTALIFQSLEKESEKKKSKKKNVLRALEFYNIEPNEIDYTTLYRTLLDK